MILFVVTVNHQDTMGIALSKRDSQRKSPSGEAYYAPIEEDYPWVWALRDADVLDWKKKYSSDHQKIQSHAQEQSRLPVKISDQLYLGDANSVRRVGQLEEKGITAVLNMAGPMALPKKTLNFLRQNEIRYKSIDSQDEFDYALLAQHCNDARKYMESVLSEGGTCVVHCVAGMNRSVLIVAAFYMLTTRTPVLETIRHIRCQRGNVALQNEGFQEQLVALARRENLLGDEPGKPGSMQDFIPPPPKAMKWMVRDTQSTKQNPLDKLNATVS